MVAAEPVTKGVTNVGREPIRTAEENIKCTTMGEMGDGG